MKTPEVVDPKRDLRVTPNRVVFEEWIKKLVFDSFWGFTTSLARSSVRKKAKIERPPQVRATRTPTLHGPPSSYDFSPSPIGWFCSIYFPLMGRGIQFAQFDSWRDDETVNGNHLCGTRSKHFENHCHREVLCGLLIDGKYLFSKLIVKASIFLEYLFYIKTIYSFLWIFSADVSRFILLHDLLSAINTLQFSSFYFVIVDGIQSLTHEL